ncbi:signal peptidase I [Microbacterium gorillae]|uniref:signal peptidase I n=1 Tax=Microbacterium gorillae TaxID=1231063 RepID=UPI00058D0E4C|nr:signal peptidase I [Microbacterium gorillae]
MSAVEESLPLSRRDARQARTGRTRRKRGWLAFFRDIVVIVIIALIVSFVVKSFVVRSFYIPSGSMENTLKENDRILVDELSPRFTGYHRGDIVVFRDPGGWLPPEAAVDRGPIAAAGEWVLSLVGLAAPDSSEHLVKRVIGLPGDHVVCCDAAGRIEVNGTPLDESAYVKLSPGRSTPKEIEFDVTVPEGSLWVMGDNRDHSRDSRLNMDQPSKGFVPLDGVVGRVFLRTWPLDRFGGLGSDGNAFLGVPGRDRS